MNKVYLMNKMISTFLVSTMVACTVAASATACEMHEEQQNGNSIKSSGAHTKSSVSRKSSIFDKSDNRKSSGFYASLGLGMGTATKFEEKEDELYVSKAPKVKSPIYGAAFGYRFNDYLRADINGQYSKFKYSASRETGNSSSDGSENLSQSIKSYAIFVNAYLDISNRTIFTPYFTAGIGAARNEPGNLNLKGSGDEFDVVASGRKVSNFAWNAGTGIKVKVHKNVDLDFSYTYLNLGKIKSSEASIKDPIFDTEEIISASSKRLNTHRFMTSLVWNF